MSVSVDDVFIGGQLLQSHGSPGVELLGGDTHFAAQAEFAAVGEASGDVDINGGSCTARTIDGSAYGYKAINFRIGPSKDFPTLSLPNDRTAIDNGKTVYEYARYYEADADEFWSYIEWNGYTGWVMTRYTK